MSSHHESSTSAAIEAVRRGFQPIPIQAGGKRPYGSGWTHYRWKSLEQVETSFDQWAEQGAPGIGLLLGKPSGGLVDVDLDHPKAAKFRDYFLPPTDMLSGRPGNPNSHYWYLVDDEELPGTRRYRMPDGSISVEIRTTGSQTVIPPSKWHGEGRPAEKYRWEGEPFGGEEGPARVSGRLLSIQVALMGLGAILLEAWPDKGGRHDAYLALAGGVLRYGEGVHPWWERNLPVLISALAEVTHDDDGPDSRVKEVMGTTIRALQEGRKAVGFPRLSELIGTDAAEAARRQIREVESLSGYKPEGVDQSASSHLDRDDEELPSTLPPQGRNPLEERLTTWDALDLEPYLNGEIVMPEPSILTRSDGKGLFYPGRVNSLYGLSESAKSWISLMACVQEMAKGERVVYFDLEDEPVGTINRLRRLGVGDEDIKNQFVYVHPETPLAPMQKGRFGASPTDEGIQANKSLREMLNRVDPTLIVADGMTVLYGLHGLDTNDAMGTDIITSWFKSLTRSGRTSVIVIDHTGKGSGTGASPIGAHHKIAMVQGTAIRADAIDRPMDGQVGTISLAVYKDRPGAVRAISSKHQEQIAGVVTMDSTEEGVTRFSIDPADDDTFVLGEGESEKELNRLARGQDMAEAILALFGGDLDMYLTTGDALRELEKAGGEEVDRDDVYSAWNILTGRGDVIREGSNRWTKFRLSPPAPGDDDDDEEED